MNQLKPQIHKRRNYFVEKKLQVKFILQFCLLLAITGLLTIGIIYFLAMRSTTVSIVNSRVIVRTTADFILPILIQTVIIVTIIVSLAAILVTLFVSHRIFGPLYRLKKMLQAFAEGDFSDSFRIRRNDQIQDLAEAFNRMLDKIKQELGALKDNIYMLKEKTDVITKIEADQHKGQDLGELSKIVLELKKIMQRFKI